MAAIASYLRVLKLEHSVFSLPLLAAGIALSRAPLPAEAGLLLAALVSARAAALVLNRWLDRRLDALNPRTAGREMAAGRVSPPQAAVLLAALLAVYLLSARALGHRCLTLSPVPIAVFTLYPLLKRVTWLCHAGVGLGLALLPPAVWVAMKGTAAVPLAVALFAGFVWAWGTGFDAIYGILDIASDRETGVKSFPARFGARAAILFAAVMFGAAISFLAGTVLCGKTTPLAAAGLAATAAVFAGELFLAARGRIETAFFSVNSLAGLAAMAAVWFSVGAA